MESPVPSPETVMTLEQLHTIVHWIVGTGVAVVASLGAGMLIYGRYVLGKIKVLGMQLTNLSISHYSLINLLVETERKTPGKSRRKPFLDGLLKLYHSSVISGLLGGARQNPLPEVEPEKLRGYYETVRSGGTLSREEAEDFVALADKLKHDKESKGEMDEGAVVLAGIAGLVLGLITDTEND